MKTKILSLLLVLCMCIMPLSIEVQGAEVVQNNIETEIVTQDAETAVPNYEEEQEVIVGVPSAYAVMQVDDSEDAIAEQKLKWEIICQADPQFHLDTSYYLDNSYYSSYDKLTQEQFDELQQVAKTITKDCTTQYEKIEAIVEYVSYNVFYDYAYYYDRENQSVYINPYEVYKNKRTVCDGYERLVRVFCLSLGIPCMRLLGEDHTYSVIYDDEQKRWIYADATWASRNEYTPEGTWIHGGYNSYFFDMTPEEFALCSNHENYRVGGLLDDANKSVYYAVEFGSYSSETNTLSADVYGVGARFENVTVLGECFGYQVKGFRDFSCSFGSLYGSAFDGKNIVLNLDLSNVQLEEISFKNITKIKSVKLPTILKTINSQVFYGCSELETIDLSNTKVETIGNYAFFNCTKLKNIIFPSTLKTIGSRVFTNCESLEKIDLSNTQITSLSEGQFYYLTYIKSICLPKTLQTIGATAFYNCAELTEINLSETQVTDIGESAFAWCESLKEVDLSGLNLKEISSQAFYNTNKLETLILPNTLETIGTDAFAYTSSLKYILLPNSVKTIGDGAFYSGTVNTNIETTLSDSILRLNDGAVWGYKKVTASEYFYTVSFDGNGATSGGMVDRIYGSDVSYTLPANSFIKNNMVFVGWNTKVDGSGTSYKDKETVKKITTKLADKIVLYAQWTEEKYAITYELNGGINHPLNPSTYTVTTETITLKDASRQGYEFKGWYKDPQYKTKVTEIPKGSKGNITLYAQWKKIETPEEDKQILSIKNAKVSLSATSYNYDGKAKKPSVTITLNSKKLKKDTDYKVTYSNNKNIGTATVTITGINSYKDSIKKTFTIKAKKGATFTSSKCKYEVTGTSTVKFTGITSSSMKKVTIPKTVKYGGKSFKVTEVGKNALKKKTKVTTVVIGANVKTIGVSAFEGCKKLSSVTIGSAVTTIDDKAFKSCTALKSITVPSKVTTIDKEAFYGCKNLKTITIKSTKLKTVGKNALKGINAKATIKVPSSKLKAYKSLLKKKGQGSKVKIVKSK